MPMQVTKPGVFDISVDDYDADPCPEPSLRGTAVKEILQFSPLHAWTATPRLNPDFEESDSETFDIGNTMHDLLLRGIDNIAEIAADSWRTKEAQTARELAREAGKYPLLTKHAIRARRAVASIKAQLAGHADFPDAFTEGKPERTLIWQEPTRSGPIWCRVRLDWEPVFIDQPRAFLDFKSTESANPMTITGGFTGIARLGYHYSACFYRRGIRAVLGVENPQMGFVFGEKKPPYAISVIPLKESWIEIAEDDVQDAIELWGHCLHTGKWPAYGNKAHWADVPEWLAARTLERRAIRQMEKDAEEREGAARKVWDAGAQAPLGEEPEFE